MQIQSGAFSGMLSLFSAIGQLARVEEKPATDWENPVWNSLVIFTVFLTNAKEQTMASKCPKCEKTVYFGKLISYFLLYFSI